MSNPFDQFDEQPKQPQQGAANAASGSNNVFDQFDEPVEQQEYAPSAGDRARMATQGLTLNFGDEIEAGLRTGFGFTGDYEAVRDDIRQDLNTYREERPIESAALEIAGSLPTLLVPGGAAVRTAQLANRGASTVQQVNALKSITSAGVNAAKNSPMARTVAVGAAEGTVAGVGASEADNISGVTSDALHGGATGAALGGGVSAASNFIGGIVRALPSSVTNLVSRGSDDVAARNALRKGIDDHIGTESNSDVFSSPERIAERLEGADAAMRKATGGAKGTTLADAPELEPLAIAANRGAPANDFTQKTLDLRADMTRDNVLEVFDPTLSADGVLTPNHYMPATGKSTDSGSGLAHVSNIADTARKEASKAADPLYQAVYNRMGNNITTKQVENLRKRPLFNDAYMKAQKILSSGNTNGRIIQPMERLDMTKRVLDDMIGGTSGNERRALIALKDDLVQRMDVATTTPDGTSIYQKAREITQDGFNAKAAVLALDDNGKPLLNASMESVADTVDGQLGDLFRIGLGRQVREQIVQKGTRDSRTGKLLTDAQLDNYNKLVGNTADANLALNAERTATRTANLAKLGNPDQAAEDYFGLVRQMGGDDNAAAVLFTSFAQPNVFMIPWATRWLGQTTAAKQSNERLFKAMQDELYKDYDKAHVDSILTGDFEKVPLDVLKNFADKMAQMANPTVVDASTDKESKKKSVLNQ